jgi:nicotinamidase-related amidase
MAEAIPKPNELVIEKRVNSAFIGTDLERELRSRGLKELVLAGFTTDHCLSTSARMAANLGFDVTVLSDATATFDRPGADGRVYAAEDVHQISLASLRGEFARIATLTSLTY